jgi:ribosomal protein L40E
MLTPNASDRKIAPQRCTNCGFDNEPGRSKCQNCGLPLPVAARAALDEASTATPVVSPFTTGSATLSLTKRTCPECGHANMPAAARCTKCGTPLDISDLFAKPVTSDTAPTGTTVLNDRKPVIPALNTNEVRAVRVASAQRLATSAMLRLEIVGANSVVTVKPQAESTIGRRDPISNSAPEVDLTSFAAYRMGISRRHATLRVTDGVVEILDLGSSNGTFVNGQRLNAYEPYTLSSGDEIGLGRMVVRIHFQPKDNG